MDVNKIVIKGARENNLKDINLELPKNKLIVMTGLSGSGKTTLAFDTIYAEGQRRYVESLSSYARQFLGGMSKPDVDSITGLSPAIAINQKSVNNNPRSTVGTVTEIYDYLRLLYARIGIPYCPTHNKPINGFTTKEIIDKVLSYPLDTKLIILAPLVKGKKGTFKDIFDKLSKSGFVRVRLDGQICNIDELNLEDKNKKHDIDVVIDRLKISSDCKARLTDSITQGLEVGEGLITCLLDDVELSFSTNYSCPECGFTVGKLEPRLFSFNAPSGACPECMGIGVKKEVMDDLLIPDKSLSINEGGIVFLKNMVGSCLIEWQEQVALCKHYNIDMDKPIQDLSKEEQYIILNGADEAFEFDIKTGSGNILHRTKQIEGIKQRLKRLYLETNSEMTRQWYGNYIRDCECDACHGKRLNKEALSVRVGKYNIIELCTLPINEIYDYLNNIKLTTQQEDIARLILKEIKSRLGFLINVGLDYLTLARNASTLSGGESQRIRLATQIGSNLTGVLYVLDEPSIGLHQRDNSKLINALKQMRDIGNTLLVVEHDEETMMSADYLVDIGPGSGVHGGEVVASGTVEEVMNNPKSLTGKYLSGKLKIDTPSARRKGNGFNIEIKGAKGNNLKNVDVKIPLGTLTVITGVSGSGKSSLINETMCQGILSKWGNKDASPLPFNEINGLENIDKMIDINQEPIGRTSRSNPATYTGVFDLIRELFSLTKDARIKGFGKNVFSFNNKGGRCEKCQGDGVIRVPMHFLPDVYVVCEDCGGKRYSEEVLSVRYKDKNIFEVLEMTIDEALVFFENMPKIKNILQTLVDVGLGYIKLGQMATTLSGGEAQRLKLASELQRRSTGKTMYILDEPTTGLHNHDVKKLLDVLHRLVDLGNSVIVIEHNLEVIKNADYIIDLGPEGGNKGGYIIAKGTPEEICKVKESYTGQYLKKILNS